MSQEPKKLSPLDELSSRIKQIEDSRKLPLREEPVQSPSKVAIELVSGVAVGILIGYWLDKWLGTKPLFLIICTLLGFAGGFWNIYKMSQRPSKTEEKSESKEQK